MEKAKLAPRRAGAALSTQARPPWLSAMCLTRARPIPLPRTGAPEASPRDVEPRVGQRRLHLGRQIDALALGAVAVDVHGLRDGLPHVAVGKVVGLPSSLDAREVEHVLDERREPLALAHDDVQVLLPLGLARYPAGLE